jgi:hypothetical protein
VLNVVVERSTLADVLGIFGPAGGVGLALEFCGGVATLNRGVG